MTLTEARIAGPVYQRMSDMADDAYPEEGCGVLVGRFDGDHADVVAVTRGRNLNTERARDRYVLDPADIVEADREARARDLDIVGYWHSHPDHPAHPSQFDTDHAWTDYVYVICNTTEEGTGDVNAFSLLAEGGPFEPLLLVLTPADSGREP
ncbi:MAG: M67 family metallopeptidase [Candidatus Dormibacteraeota bacterium]|nr:M67 family metallopeptidase [Candidatus Dormibacteraeota bacterium]